MPPLLDKDGIFVYNYKIKTAISENGNRRISIHVKNRKTDHSPELFNDKLLDPAEKFGSVLSVSFELDSLGKVQAEDTHNRLSIYCISARNEVNVIITECHLGNKILNIIDCGESDSSLVFHNKFLPFPLKHAPAYFKPY